MNYNRTFSELVSYFDFSLEKDELGFWVRDLQGANLGDIEADRFDTAAQIVDRMDLYVRDYLLCDDDCEVLYGSCEEALEKEPNHPLRCFLDLIVNHIGEVNLERAMGS